LNIPSLDTQKEAVKSFDLISKAILVKKKEQESLISLIKSRFIEMFFNSQKFVEEPLGKNVIQMNIGPFGSDLKKDAFVSKDNSFCMVYEQKHAIDKTFSDNNRFINHQTYEKLKRFAVGPSDIIVTCRGTIGKIYVLPKEASIGIIHPSLMMIRLNRDIYEPTFFSFLLQKELYAFQANGATIAMGIKASELSKRKMIVPPMNRQKDFVDYYQLLDKSGFVIRKQIENLQELLNSKMDEYFGQ
jgi:type I restriction enzyme, S subunit